MVVAEAVKTVTVTKVVPEAVRLQVTSQQEQLIMLQQTPVAVEAVAQAAVHLEVQVVQAAQD